MDVRPTAKSTKNCLATISHYMVICMLVYVHVYAYVCTCENFFLFLSLHLPLFKGHLIANYTDLACLNLLIHCGGGGGYFVLFSPLNANYLKQKRKQLH